MDFYCRLINREYPLERDYIPDDLIPCDFKPLIEILPFLCRSVFLDYRSSHHKAKDKKTKKGQHCKQPVALFLPSPPGTPSCIIPVIQQEIHGIGISVSFLISSSLSHISLSIQRP